MKTTLNGHNTHDSLLVTFKCRRNHSAIRKLQIKYNKMPVLECEYHHIIVGLMGPTLCTMV